MQQHAAVYMAHVLLDILEHHRLFLLRPKLVSVMKVGLVRCAIKIHVKGELVLEMESVLPTIIPQSVNVMLGIQAKTASNHAMGSAEAIFPLVVPAMWMAKTPLDVTRMEAALI